MAVLTYSLKRPQFIYINRDFSQIGITSVLVVKDRVELL